MRALHVLRFGVLVREPYRTPPHTIPTTVSFRCSCALITLHCHTNGSASLHTIVWRLCLDMPGHAPDYRVKGVLPVAITMTGASAHLQKIKLDKCARNHSCKMVTIETPASLESFRKFVMFSTCRSYAPRSYLDDGEIFAERESNGEIYVEAEDKVTLKKLRDVTFVNARGVLGIIYKSKSGNTSLKWRKMRRFNGKVTGEASSNTLANLSESGVITIEWVKEYLKEKMEKEKQEQDPEHNDTSQL